MKDGFVKVGCATPEVTVADPYANTSEILKYIKNLEKAGARIMVFPELCITGYSCRDLFLQDILIKEAWEQLIRIAESTANLDSIIFAGLPFEYAGKLYNTAAALHMGKLLGLVPKRKIPDYGEFYERRQFTPGPDEVINVTVPWLGGKDIRVPFGGNILFSCSTMPHLVIGCEICEDLWAPDTPGMSHALAGATVLVNLSASDAVVGKTKYRLQLVKDQSARLVCGYVYTSAGPSESTTDLVFGGHDIIAENGTVLAESPRFEEHILCSEIDVDRLAYERRRMTTYPSPAAFSAGYTYVPFSLVLTETSLTRYFDPHPFVPADQSERKERCEDILSIQSMGLVKRLKHTHSENAVIGISGGLDSTLALLVTARAFDIAGIDRKKITAVTMPCFGTTDRTYENACRLTRSIGAGLLEINIKEAVNLHFKDIGHNPDVHDVTYENCQARERTQVLMDLANQSGGLVIGTGDLSELALGWATYNGDHMSMYAVNSSVPKTLVRHLVKYYADTCGVRELSDVLTDILATPVSPELLPPEDGKISQKTEDLVGPYELHDFFLYNMQRLGFPPLKIFRIAQKVFAGSYDDAVILKWEKTFYRRFFSQQFKRSCLPDGPKVGSVALSPRGDLRMPSDASAEMWQRELNSIREHTPV